MLISNEPYAKQGSFFSSLRSEPLILNDCLSNVTIQVILQLRHSRHLQDDKGKIPVPY